MSIMWQFMMVIIVVADLSFEGTRGSEENGTECHLSDAFALDPFPRNSISGYSNTMATIDPVSKTRSPAISAYALRSTETPSPSLDRSSRPTGS
jgi:hypothetical protein